MRLKSYLARFLATEASAGALLALATIIALAVANSPAAEAYFHLLHAEVWGLSLHHWVNDGLMVVFFFLVGMEIKREMVAGELSNPKQAALPIAGAIGGMIAPALIYYWLNPHYPESRGWGIPMATDIAFAVGVLGFFGRRVPFPLKIFLLALAIVDDLGAVLVIAFFYTKEISGPFLGLAALGLGATVLLKKAGIRSYLPYIAAGTAVWYCVLRSGVHATVAGVLLGFLTPLHFRKDKPLEDLVHKIHPWVSLAIMPVFALANAGVSFAGAEPASLAGNSIFQGIGLGLLLGKPLGIVGIAWLAVKMKIAQLPRGIGWGDMLGVGFLGGIGFTMALFVSSLALYPEQEIYSKSGILLGSLAAIFVGSLVLNLAFRKERISGSLR
jgi:NhaA family Na+:H+ antiporter